MSEEKRKAGDYTIIQALHIGDWEIVIGEDPANQDGRKYMCAFCTANELFARYDEVLASENYPEIVEIYGQRVAEQAEKTRVELNALKIQGIPNAALTAKDYTPVSYQDDLNNKVKNLFLMTKMQDVGGIAQTEAQKPRDLFMKTQYLDEITGGRGTIWRDKKQEQVVADLFLYISHYILVIRIVQLVPAENRADCSGIFRCHRNSYEGCLTA